MQRTMLAAAAAALTIAAAPMGREAARTVPFAGRLCRIPVLPDQASVPLTLGAWAEGAQLFQGLGTGSHKVTTASPPAQAYFDQGLRWLYAFNHDEATRSFARAAVLDPACAMCFWGVALTIGPNYNLPMMSAPRGRVAYDAMRRAMALAPRGSKAEQALIAALAHRYPSANALSTDQFAAVQADYARAMQNVAAAFAGDDDVLVLTAEALMTTTAWKLGRPDGTPARVTPPVIGLLDKVLARTPGHAGANHYYIHALEESPHPEQAEAAADRLGTLMPGAGHIVHMPSHIYQRIDRYADGARVNDLAARADLAYYAHAAPLDYYVGYTIHNWHFQAYSAAEIGRRAEADAAMRKARLLVTDDMLASDRASAWTIGAVYVLPARFGQWQALAATPAPAAATGDLFTAWHWAHGAAMAALHRLPEAGADLAAVERALAAAKPADTAGLNAKRDVLRVASLTLRARITQSGGDLSGAIALWRDAAKAADALSYDEPADWLVPPRLSLGAALLRDGKPAAAEAEFRADLNRAPGNGWALFGIAQAVAAQGRAAEAKTARAAFERAWRDADTPLTSAAF